MASVGIIEHVSECGDLASVPAGPDLLAVLLGLDLPSLSEAELLCAARAWERQDRFVAARRNALYAALDDSEAPPYLGHPAVSGPEGWVELIGRARTRSLAGSTGMSNTAAAQRISAASLLTGLLSDTGAALEQGLVSEASARLIARRVSGLDHDTALAVQCAVLDDAPHLAPARLDRLLRREIAQRAPLEEQARNRAARRQRKVSGLRPLAGGMASLEVVGPAEDVAVLHTAIAALGDATHAAAKAAARDTAPGAGLGAEVEGIDAHRFDALVNLACGVLHGDGLPERHGRRPSIQVVVPAATLLGISEAPGELDGHGPVDADTARAIAFDTTATWRRVLTDPQGPGPGLRHYDLQAPAGPEGPGDRPGPDLHRARLLHDRPGNARSTTKTPFPRGSTSEINNDAKCPTEHQLKTAGLLTAKRDPATGQTNWTDRHGTTYLRLPETLPQAIDADDRLADITRALRQGRHRINRIRDRAAGAQTGRVMPPALQPNDLDDFDDDPPPF